MHWSNDEFSLLSENAEELGLPFEKPPTVGRVSVALDEGPDISAVVWGEGPPEVVLLHGGRQNARTWDSVALALGRPLVAIDLPGHGMSGDLPDRSFAAPDIAPCVAAAIRSVAPEAGAIVGMSLGGLTALVLSTSAPDIVRGIVLVDVTPNVTAEKAADVLQFVAGRDSFSSLEEMVEYTVAHNPGRTVPSLRRGVRYNATERADGRWIWRHSRGQSGPYRPPDYTWLWEAVERIEVPLLLVRGMKPGSVVDDADEEELLRRAPAAMIARVESAGHGVQGAAPKELAGLIAGFLDGNNS